MKLSFIYIFIFIISMNLFAQGNCTSDSPEKYFSVKGTAINTIGHFSEAWESGSGFYASYGLNYASKWALIFQTGYNSYKSKGEFGFQGDAKFNVIPLQVGGRYYFMSDTFRPFLYAMNGINIVSADYTYLNEEENQIEKVDKSDWKYNFQLGVGIGIKFLNNLELDIAGLYNSHILRADLPYNMTGLEVNIGLNLYLN